VENCIENHMYASQWFLTLFTAKFPLFLVFHILDVFLYQGMETIFQVSFERERKINFGILDSLLLFVNTKCNVNTLRPDDVNESTDERMNYYSLLFF
jgi:hypothetical protein